MYRYLFVEKRDPKVILNICYKLYIVTKKQFTSITDKILPLYRYQIIIHVVLVSPDVKIQAQDTNNHYFSHKHMKHYFVFSIKWVTSAAGDHVFIPIQHIPHWTA